MLIDSCFCAPKSQLMDKASPFHIWQVVPFCSICSKKVFSTGVVNQTAVICASLQPVAHTKHSKVVLPESCEPKVRWASSINDVTF